MKKILLSFLALNAISASALANEDLFYAAEPTNYYTGNSDPNVDGYPFVLVGKSLVFCGNSTHGNSLYDPQRKRFYRIKNLSECFRMQNEMAAQRGIVFKITVDGSNVIEHKSLGLELSKFNIPKNTTFDGNRPFNIQENAYLQGAKLIACARDLVETRAGGLSGLGSVTELLNSTLESPAVSASILGQKLARCNDLKALLTPDTEILPKDQYTYLLDHHAFAPSFPFMQAFVRPTVECRKKELTTAAAYSVLGAGARAGYARCDGSNGRSWIEVRVGAQYSAGIGMVVGTIDETTSHPRFYDQRLAEEPYISNSQSVFLGSTGDAKYFDPANPVFENNPKLRTVGLGTIAGRGREYIVKTSSLPNRDRSLAIQLMRTILKRDHD